MGCGPGLRRLRLKKESVQKWTSLWTSRNKCCVGLGRSVFHRLRDVIINIFKNLGARPFSRLSKTTPNCFSVGVSTIRVFKKGKINTWSRFRPFMSVTLAPSISPWVLSLLSALAVFTKLLLRWCLYHRNLKAPDHLHRIRACSARKNQTW